MTLPPLPEPVNARDVGTLLRDPTSPWPYIQPPLYTATQMHAYARAAVEAEREALRALLRDTVPQLTEIVRMPNAEFVADAHNAALSRLRAAAAERRK